jgi:hypothetical protein
MLGYLFHNMPQSLFADSAVDVHSHLWSRVPCEDLRFLDRHPAVNHQINVGKPNRVEIELTLWGGFGNASFLQIHIQ